MKTLTVGQLRALIADVPDDMEVMVRAVDGDDSVVGGLTGVSVDAGCTEVEMLVLDADYEAESLNQEPT